MARMRKALFERYRPWSVVFEILAVLVGLPHLASAAPVEVKFFRPDSVVEAVRRTWPEWEPPQVVQLPSLEDGISDELQKPKRLEASQILGLSPEPFRRALSQRLQGKMLDRKGIESTFTDLGVTVQAMAHGPPILRPKGKHTEPTSEEIAAALSLFQRIEYRNDIVDGVKSLRQVRTFDGHKQLAEHLQKSYGRKPEEAKALAASFDHAALVHEYQAGADDLQLMRLYGGTSKKKGRWFFCCLDRPDAQATALPISNTMDRMATVPVPYKTRMLVGVVADQKDPAMRPSGGSTQFFIPDGLPIPDSAYSDYEIAKAEHPKSPDDLLVVRDDGSTVRFRPVRQAARPGRVQAIAPGSRSLFQPSPLLAPTSAGK